MTLYLMYSTVCMGILLLFYHAILEKEKMHHINRGYLIFSLVFSLSIPLIPVGMSDAFIPWFQNQQFSEIQYLSQVEWLKTSPEEMTPTSERSGTSLYSLAQIVFLVYAMVAGVLFARRFPGITSRITRPIKIISIMIFAGFVVVAFSNNVNYFLKYIHLIFLLVLVHNALALLSGFSLSTVFRLPSKDRRSISIETGIQNSGLALVLIFSPRLFNGLGGMAFVAAWWGIGHILAGLSIAGLWSRKPMGKRRRSLSWNSRAANQ